MTHKIVKGLEQAVMHAKIENLEAEIERLRWQPIATAPLDGTEVDLWCKPADYPYGGRATDCHYHCGEWLKYGADPEIGFIKIENATHWRPLPDPPVSI
jgi:hypothetical protein